VLSYLVEEEGRFPREQGKKDVISRMIKRFDKDPCDGKNGETSQDRESTVCMQVRGGERGRG